MNIEVMSIQKFLINPVGKGSSSVARRDHIRAGLSARFESLYKKSKSRWKVLSMREDKSGDIYFRVTVPSEVNDDVNYDVIIRVIHTVGANGHPLVLANRAIQLFSNSPGFTFTYAYVFNKMNMIIPNLKKYLATKSLTEAPSVRNPNESSGFEKSVYFALLYLTRYWVKEFNEASVVKVSSKYNYKDLTKSLVSATKKIDEYQKANKRRLDKEREEKRKKAAREEFKNKIINKLTLGRLGKTKPKKAKPRKPIKSTVGRKTK